MESTMADESVEIAGCGCGTRSEEGRKAVAVDPGTKDRNLKRLRRIEDRLLGTLWYLAATWGRVTPRGLAVPISLTHQTLGELAGAQRPSVTLGMAALRDRGLVDRMPDGTYVLCGDHALWREAPFKQQAAVGGMRPSGNER